MADEEKTPAEPEGSTEEAKPDPPPPEWEFKKEFGINNRMREVIHLAVSATESEIAVLKRKLEKLHYGS